MASATPEPTATNTAVPTATTEPTPEPTETPTEQPTVEPTVEPTATAQPNLEKLIGSMILTGFRGTTAERDARTISELNAHHINNIVLFAYDPADRKTVNIASPEQLKRLTDDLHNYIPNLLIAIDQEGGDVARLDERTGFSASLSAADLATLGVEWTVMQATQTAQLLREYGISLNLAPVVDLNVNPDNPIIARYGRSFSADSNTVIDHARAFINAHHQNGVKCVLKHFPGHGSSRADSHLGFVDVSDTWSLTELIPFTTLIREGIVDAVMTAHIFNSNLDDTYPATLSKRTITDQLRNRIGFDGVIISDDMLMGAIAQHYGFEEAIVLAVQAGVDMIALSYAPHASTHASNGEDGEDEDVLLPVRAVQAIASAVARGEISLGRVEESAERIRKFKF